MYHLIKKQDMVEALELINAFGEKFPLLSVNQINFYELAKFYQKDPKDLISMIVFLDCLKQMNNAPGRKNSYFINLEEVSKMKVKKNQQQWSFELYKNAREKIKLQHQYTHQF